MGLEQGFRAWLAACLSVLGQAVGVVGPVTVAVDLVTSHASWTTLRHLGQDRAVEVAARMVEAAPA